MTNQPVGLRPFDERGVYTLRKLAVGELRESSRKSPFFRNPSHGFKTAHAAQHRVDAKSIDKMASQRKVKDRFGHKSSRDPGSIASRAATPPPLAYMTIHLQQRQNFGELLVTFTERSQFFSQKGKQLALQERFKRLRQVLQ